MLVVFVAQARVQLRQHERRCAAQFVQPADLGIAHLDLALVEDPVGEIAVARAVVEPDAGDRDHAVAVAAQRHARPVDRERMQPQLGVQQRAPRNHCVHDRQHDRLAPVDVVDAHVGDDEPRQQPAPIGLDRADRDLEAGPLRHRGDDVVPVALDARQQPVAQREEPDRRREEHQPGEDLERVEPGRDETPDAREEAREPARRLFFCDWRCDFGLHAAPRCLYSRADLPERITFDPRCGVDSIGKCPI